MTQRQRKALGWIVHHAAEEFAEQRGKLCLREADDIENDLEAVLSLLPRDDRKAVSALLTDKAA